MNATVSRRNFLLRAGAAAGAVLAAPFPYGADAAAAAPNSGYGILAEARMFCRAGGLGGLRHIELDCPHTGGGQGAESCLRPWMPLLEAAAGKCPADIVRRFREDAPQHVSGMFRTADGCTVRMVVRKTAEPRGPAVRFFSGDAGLFFDPPEAPGRIVGPDGRTTVFRPDSGAVSPV